MLAAVFLLQLFARAQDTTPPEGTNAGNYNIQQSVEFGYRHTDFTGSRSVYNTFVNLNSGPRLLEHTLGMRSLNHQGRLFDNFFLTSFGYGGDPNNFSQLRVSKNRWYNFSGTFRRDRNLWDYNLLANPLNPTDSTPSMPIGESPHRFETVRRMSDFNLTLLPQSRVRLRAGYSRNVSEGPSFTSFHEGTEALIFQQWKNTLNSYRAGIDFQLIPRTNISYDQFWHYYKGDTSWLDKTFAFRLADGTPVDLGLIFNSPARQPCATPVIDFGSNPPTADPACNAFQDYRRAGPVRTSYPTEQLSFQSRYFDGIDLSGRLAYSSSEGELPDFAELFRGLASRTNLRQYSILGNARSKRVSVTLDGAVTWHATDRLSVTDVFHSTDFRIPGQWVFSESSQFGASMLVPPIIFNPSTCNPPSVVSGCPQHTSSSPADITSETFGLFLGQKDRNNQFELQYQFLQGLSGRLGYRFRHRAIAFREEESSQEVYLPTLPNRGACASLPLQADGSCRVSSAASTSQETDINQRSLVLGIQARPWETLRLNLDLELMSADNAFTRISPRHLQHYKFRVQYKPAASWALNSAINILENRHNVPDINNLQHNRSYAFGAVVSPAENVELDLGYDYNDIYSQTNICFVASVQPIGSTLCPTAAAFLQQVSFYENQTHYGYANIQWNLNRWVSTNLGYAVVSTDGSTLILSPNALPGPLQFSYHKPHAGLSLNLSRGFTWRAAWGYYGYNEKAPAGFGIASRDFRGNLVTVSLRHLF